MPEWLLERGIGEDRAVRIADGEIAEARIYLEGVPRAGTGRPAVLKQAGMSAIASDGADEYVLPKGAPGVTEGSALTIEITREKIPGGEPWKRPLAKVAESIAIPLRDADALPFPGPDDRLEQAGWSDLLEEARSGIIRFADGELRVSPTPAMTLIDVDGTLPIRELAMAGAEAAAAAILRHGIGGSIGIDLPTLQGKAERLAVAEAIDAKLSQPFERTAMNGFGFLQIVRPRRHASLFELAQDRAAFEARALLRRAARETGAIRLAAHPAVVAALRAEWIEALARQVGGGVTLRPDAKLSMSGGHAEPA